jgi:hypothetical protein
VMWTADGTVPFWIELSANETLFRDEHGSPLWL